MRKMTFRYAIFILLALIVAACTPQQAPAESFVKVAAPDFSLDNALGGQVSLSDYSGKPVLLFFHMAVG